MRYITLIGYNTVTDHVYLKVTRFVSSFLCHPFYMHRSPFFHPTYMDQYQPNYVITKNVSERVVAVEESQNLHKHPIND